MVVAAAWLAIRAAYKLFTLFEIVKDSITQLWKIRLKAQQGLGFLLVTPGVALMAIFKPS